MAEGGEEPQRHVPPSSIPHGRTCRLESQARWAKGWGYSSTLSTAERSVRGSWRKEHETENPRPREGKLPGRMPQRESHVQPELKNCSFKKRLCIDLRVCMNAQLMHVYTYVYSRTNINLHICLLLKPL